MALCPSLPVLLYHHVGPDHKTFGSTSERFTSHMRYLSEHGYKTLTGKQYEACAMGSSPQPVKAVLITFDDGYASSYTNALPILERFGMHAVAFVITQKVVDGPPRRGAIEPANEEDLYLRWAEIDKMIASGVFEAHSHSHAHVRWGGRHFDTTEDYLRRLEADLATSRRLLTERVGGAGLNHLAWPWGESTEDGRVLARTLGFSFQYTVRNDFNTPATSLEQINRLLVDGTSLPAFVARLEFFRSSLPGHLYPRLRRKYDWMKRVIAKKEN